MTRWFAAAIPAAILLVAAGIYLTHGNDDRMSGDGPLAGFDDGMTLYSVEPKRATGTFTEGTIPLHVLGSSVVRIDRVESIIDHPEHLQQIGAAVVTSRHWRRRFDYRPGYLPSFVTKHHLATPDAAGLTLQPAIRRGRHPQGTPFVTPGYELLIGYESDGQMAGRKLVKVYYSVGDSHFVQSFASLFVVCPPGNSDDECGNTVLPPRLRRNAP